MLSRARPHAPPDLVRLEFLEIKAQHEFEEEVSREMFPQYQDGTFASNFKLGFHEYLSLFKKRTLLRRVAIGTLIMFFQQWTGVNAVLYYAPSIFNQLGLTGSTNSLLATGVVGVAMFLATIPARFWLDFIKTTGRVMQQQDGWLLCSSGSSPLASATVGDPVLGLSSRRFGLSAFVARVYQSRLLQTG